jgi:hypothetical protein
MPDINAAFPSKYLKAHDIDGDMLVTIDTVRAETMKSRDGKEESLPILFVREWPKGMVLNRTNAKKISQLLGSSDTDDWAGGQVLLYATETQFGGDTVECSRIKPAPKKAKAAAAKVATRPVDAVQPTDDGPPF